MAKYSIVLAVLVLITAAVNLAWAEEPQAQFGLTREICNANPRTINNAPNTNAFPRPETVTIESYPAYQTERWDECDKIFPKNPLSGLMDFILSAAGIFTALGVFMTAGFGVLITLRSKLYEYKKLVKDNEAELQKSVVRAADPIYSTQGTYEHEAVNMVLVGEGGSGKTTLIRSFTCAGNSRPIVSTGGFETYSIVRDVGIAKGDKFHRRVTRIYVDDYVGQRFSDIATNEQLQKRRKYIKSTTLVIVVDLFFPSDTTTFSRDVFDNERIKEQVRFYNHEGVRQILGKILHDGDSIVLFINRLDVLKKIDQATINKAKRAYNPLAEMFRSMKGISFSIIVGSAKKGWGVVGDASGNAEAESLYEKVTARGASISEATLLAAYKENAIHVASVEQQKG